MMTIEHEPIQVLGVQAMKHNFRRTALTALTALVLTLASLPAMAQTQRNLELQTDEGQIDVPLEDGVPLRILSNGDISATAVPGFSCPTGGASCDDVQVSLAGADGGVFTVSPNPVQQGGSVTMNWNGIGAWECQGTGLTGTTWNSVNPKQPRGQQSVSTGDLQAGTSYPVELTCSNGPVTDTGIVSLTVEEDTVIEPEGCENVPELREFTGWAAATSILYNNSSHNPGVFADIYNAPFPGTTNTAHLNILKGRYAAIQFTTPSTLGSGDEGNFNSENASQVYPNGDTRIVSITRCPGVFDPQYVEDSDCIKSLGISDALKWVGPNHPESGFRCNLQAGTTYFLNMIYSRSALGNFPPTQAPCESGQTHCGSLSTHFSNLQSQ